MDSVATMKIVEDEWAAALPSLQEFVRIPNLTPAKDPEWETNGLLDKAVSHMVEWITAQNVEGLQYEVLKDPGFSPFLCIEIAGTSGAPKAACTIVMYGHLDKQPWGEGWDADTAPTSGIIKDGKLYGRGAGDDGYATYSCIIALKALQKQGIAHPRVIILAETSEESGSPHLGHYVEKLAPRIGEPSAVYCLDSGVEDYGTFWMTTSLRGAVAAVLEVSTTTQSIHSGIAGGIVPDPHRITRQLLNRLEDVETGRVKLPELFTKIPVERQEQMQALADSIGPPHLNRKTAFAPGCYPATDNAAALYKANAWEPSVAVIGQEGLPSLAAASPALHPCLKTFLAIRLPPLVDPDVAKQAIKDALERDPPCGATVKLDVKMAVGGWNGPEMKPNFVTAVTAASKATFDGKEPGYSGLGGTIPLMKMLGDMFPEASLVVCGVLGPGSNEHGPNESLPIEYTKKFTACVAHILGLLEPDAGAWPDDVPKPSAHTRKAKFCFTNQGVMIGDCLCCM